MTPRQEVEQSKRQAEETFKRALDRLGGQDHSLSDWQRTCLLQSLLSMEAGLYKLARSFVELSEANPASNAVWPQEEIGHLDLDYFTARLNDAVNSAVKERANFWRVSIPGQAK